MGFSPKQRPLALALVLCTPIAADALTINLTYDTNGQAGSVPAADPDGALLMAICRAAADYWEDIIRDPHTLNLQVRYDNGISGIGKWTQTVQSGGRAAAGSVAFKGTTTWFYDPTPNDHSEYEMASTLVRDLNPTLAALTYGGSPPGVLESYFAGNLAADAPAEAMNGIDLYSVALHEIGHGLGMSTQLSTCALEIIDGDYDVASGLANGAIFSVLVNTTGGAHTVCQNCVMSTTDNTDRQLPSATDVLALATCPSPGWSSIDLPRRDFLPGGTTNWHTAGNWVGARVPGPSDDVFCRHGIEFGGADVDLSTTGGASNLLVSSGTRVRTGSHKLDVTNTVTIRDDSVSPRAQVIVGNGGELEAFNVVVDGGVLAMGGGLADVGDRLVIEPGISSQQGELTGFGTIDVATELVHRGRIKATGGPANTLAFRSTASAPWDLDAEVLALFGNIDFESGALARSFFRTMRVGDPYSVNVAEPWTLSGELSLEGGSLGPATLSGGTLTIATGDVSCSVDALVTAPLDFTNGDIFILGNSQLVLDGAVHTTGGAFRLSNGALVEINGSCVIDTAYFNPNPGSNLHLNGPTQINGGVFDIESGARVDFNGTHDLRGGTYKGNGTLRFVGPTTVNQAVDIECLTLDFDGNAMPSKQVTLNADLAIYSPNLDLGASPDSFDSTLNINGASTSLDILGVPFWTMAGTMNVDSGTVFTFPSIDGAPFTMAGITNINGGTRWDAQATITGTVNLDTVDDTLALGFNDPADPNRIEGGVVNGPGTLRAFQAQLAGFGQVSADLDFITGSALLADDGTLTLSGSFLNVPPLIGTGDADGTLAVLGPWTLPTTSVLDINGGTVAGASLANEGIIRGSGTIVTSGLINNAQISATGNATLTIDTAGTPNLDGSGTPAERINHLLNAIDGDLTVLTSVLGDPFDGTATIAPGRTMNFAAGWELGPTGVLNMTGDTATSQAILLGPNTVLSGALNVSDEARLGASATFTAGCEVALPGPGDVLVIAGNCQINPGVGFVGSGALVVDNSATLTLANGAIANAAVLNMSSVALGAGGTARATVKSYQQNLFGTLGIQISDRPGGTDWDVLTVIGAAQFTGTLNLTMNVPTARAGDTWKIVDAGSVSGSFHTINASGAPPGTVLQVLPASDGVYVKLSATQSYADWEIEARIPLADRGPGADPDGDLIPNALELFVDGDPLVPEWNLLPPPFILPLGQNEYLAITIPVSTKIVPTDLDLHVLWSSDLMQWIEPEARFASSTFDPIDCIDYRIYRSRRPVSSNDPRGFLRIEAAP